MSGSSDPQTTTSEVKVPEFQQPFLDNLFAGAQAQYAAGTPDTTQSTGQLTDAARNLTGTAQNIQPLLNQSQQANQFLLGDVLKPGSNPALQEYIDLSNQSIARNFNQSVMPELAGADVATGNTGSSRAGVAQGLAAQGLQNTLQQNTSQLTSQGYAQGLDALVRGLSLVPSTTTAQGIPSEFQTQGANLQRTAETSDFNQQSDLLRQYADIVTRGFGNTTVNTSPGPESGGWAGAVGGGATTYAATGNPYLAAIGAFAGSR